MKKYLATLAACLVLATSAFAQFGGFSGFGGFNGFSLPGGVVGTQKQEDGAKTRKLGLEAAYGINFTPYFESAAHYMKLNASLGRMSLGACVTMFSNDVSYDNGYSYHEGSELGFSMACQVGYNFLRLKRLCLGANLLAGFYSVPFEETDSYSSNIEYDDGLLFGGELECKFLVLKNIAVNLTAAYTTAGPMFNASVALLL